MMTKYNPRAKVEVRAGKTPKRIGFRQRSRKRGRRRGRSKVLAERA
jgi:hypothetical protein